MGQVVQDAAQRDNRVVIPLIMLVVLGVLLRAVVAPLLLLATVALSYGAALGPSALPFDRLLGVDATDSSFPLFAFVFLVALGIDYNTFLMTRVRCWSPPSRSTSAGGCGGPPGRPAAPTRRARGCAPGSARARRRISPPGGQPPSPSAAEVAVIQASIVSHQR